MPMGAESIGGTLWTRGKVFFASVTKGKGVDCLPLLLIWSNRQPRASGEACFKGLVAANFATETEVTVNVAFIFLHGAGIIT